MSDKLFCAIIVAYEPDISLLNKNIEIIHQCSGDCIIIDNSVMKPINKSELLVEDFELITIGNNSGIAHAQNIGVKRAIEKKYKVLCFFDQDSRLSINVIESLYNSFVKNDCDILSPIAVNMNTKEEYPNYNVDRLGFFRKILSDKQKSIYNVDIVISSGMFVNSDIFNIVGFFDEDFFIDYVDTEFCLRCKRKGIKIQIDPTIKMSHMIGICDKKVWKIRLSVHSPYRTYYKIRNTFLLKTKGFSLFFYLYQIISVIIKNFPFLIMGDQRKEYKKYYYEAIIDGIRKKGGSYESNHKQSKKI